MHNTRFNRFSYFLFSTLVMVVRLPFRLYSNSGGRLSGSVSVADMQGQATTLIPLYSDLEDLLDMVLGKRKPDHQP